MPIKQETHQPKKQTLVILVHKVRNKNDINSIE